MGRIYHLGEEKMENKLVVARLGELQISEKLQLPEGIKDLNQTSQWLPEGAYTTFRTYEGVKALWLEKHFERLEETAYLAGKPVELDRTAIRSALRNMLEEYGQENSRVRITVDLSDRVGEIYLALAPLITPARSAYENGTQVITCNIEKRENPKAKLSNFISRAESIRAKLPKEVEEALIVNGGGQILEGLSSNFFAVKDGVLWVADDGALTGLTMKLVLEEADKLQISYHEKGICVDQLDQIDEAFITSASRSILPVTIIDGKLVGDGKVGHLTRRLMDAINKRLAHEVASI